MPRLAAAICEISYTQQLYTDPIDSSAAARPTNNPTLQLLAILQQHWQRCVRTITLRVRLDTNQPVYTLERSLDRRHHNECRPVGADESPSCVPLRLSLNFDAKHRGRTIAWMERRYVLIVPNWWHQRRQQQQRSSDGNDDAFAMGTSSVSTRAGRMVALSVVAWLALVVLSVKLDWPEATTTAEGQQQRRSSGASIYRQRFECIASHAVAMFARALAVAVPPSASPSHRLFVDRRNRRSRRWRRAAGAAVALLTSVWGMWNGMTLTSAMFELRLETGWSPVFETLEDLRVFGGGLRWQFLDMAMGAAAPQWMLQQG